jgi:hypothetical protein
MGLTIGRDIGLSFQIEDGLKQHEEMAIGKMTVRNWEMRVHVLPTNRTRCFWVVTGSLGYIVSSVNCPPDDLAWKTYTFRATISTEHQNDLHTVWLR